MRGVQGRRCRRGTQGVLGAVVMLAGIAAAPVAAEQSAGEPAQDITVETSSWYSLLSVSVPGQEVDPAVPPAVVDPIGANTFDVDDIPVGATGDGELRRGYVLLDLPREATTGEMTLPLSETEGATFGVPGPILACRVTGSSPDQWVKGGPIADAPTVECDDPPVAGEAVTESLVGEDDAPVEGEVIAYRFDLAPLVGAWSAGEPNLGIALMADVGEPQSPFQVTFNVPTFEVVGRYDVGVPPPAPTPRPPPSPPPTHEVADPAPTVVPPAPSVPPPAPTVPLASPTVPVVSPIQEPDRSPPVAAPSVAPPTGSTPPAAGPDLVAAPTLPPVVPVSPAMWLLVPLGIVVMVGSWRGLAVTVPSPIDRILG